MLQWIPSPTPSKTFGRMMKAVKCLKNKASVFIFLVKGGSPCFLVVKLDFEIAVDQQTKARNQTFEGVLDFGCPPVPAGQSRPYLVNFWYNFAKSSQFAILISFKTIGSINYETNKQ